MHVALKGYLFFSPYFEPFGGLWSGRRHLILTLLMRPSPVLEQIVQRKSAVRYQLRLPVIFCWNDGTEHTAGGFTSDVGLDGALILSRKCPPIGSEVRIEALIPSPDQSGEELRIECIGKVTRVVVLPGYSAFGIQGVFDDDHLTRQVLM